MVTPLPQRTAVTSRQTCILRVPATLQPTAVRPYYQGQQHITTVVGRGTPREVVRDPAQETRSVNLQQDGMRHWAAKHQQTKGGAALAMAALSAMEHVIQAVLPIRGRQNSSPSAAVRFHAVATAYSRQRGQLLIHQQQRTPAKDSAHGFGRCIPPHLPRP